jgi:6-pyruvoyltetrahydropterin/6-carboxytetrahydropterin synthase
VSKPLLYITRKEHFNAAHKLYNDAWTPEENEAVFGKCANANWHGHNFDLFVTVKGTPNPDTGFIMDLKLLKRIIQEEVVDHLDHRNLNEDVPFLKGIMPSIEHIATAIWQRIAPKLPANCRLHKVLLYETEQNFVEFYGEFEV